MFAIALQHAPAHTYRRAFAVETARPMVSALRKPSSSCVKMIYTYYYSKRCATGVGKKIFE